MKSTRYAQHPQRMIAARRWSITTKKRVRVKGFQSRVTGRWIYMIDVID